MLENNKIYNLDALKLLKQLSDKSAVIITDPPYGIKADKGTNGFGDSSVKKYSDNWDSISPSDEVFNEILRVGKLIIIFGGNYFTDKLPVGTHWIVWDKKGQFEFNNPFSDCELAWTNKQTVVTKKYTVIQQGFISEEKERFHPTQKPVKLFEMIIEDYTEKQDLIVDPYCGSGTTALACINTDRDFICGDISETYCKISEDRIKNNHRQFKFNLF